MRIFDILTKEEQIEFDSPPTFDILAQKKYFAVSSEIENWLKTISSPTYMVGFVLLLGYACCRGKFFPPATFHNSDITFVCKKLKVSPKSIDFTSYNLRTFSYHKQKIREYLQLLPFDSNTVQIFEHAVPTEEY